MSIKTLINFPNKGECIAKTDPNSKDATTFYKGDKFFYEFMGTSGSQHNRIFKLVNKKTKEKQFLSWGHFRQYMEVCND